MIDEYRLSDMPCAAFLTYNDFVLKSIEGDGQRREFVFAKKRDVDIDNIVSKFQRREALVEPNRFFMELKNIKHRLRF